MLKGIWSFTEEVLYNSGENLDFLINGTGTMDYACRCRKNKILFQVTFSYTFENKL